MPVAKKTTAAKTAKTKTTVPAAPKAGVKKAAVKKTVAEKPKAQKAPQAPTSSKSASTVRAGLAPARSEAPARSKKAPAKKAVTEKKVVEKKTVTPRTKASTVRAGLAPARSEAPARPKKAAAPKASFPSDYLVLMQKDPNWMHAFWGVSERRVKNAVKGGGKLVLRLYDTSNDITVQQNKRVLRDIEVPADAKSWYIQNQESQDMGAGGSVSAMLGTVQASGRFEPLVESSEIRTFGPEGQFIGGASDDKFFRASLGTGQLTGGSSGEFLSSGSFLMPTSSGSLAVSSLAFSSAAFSSQSMLPSSAPEASSDMVRRGKDFFLWVKTRLIVYGGTRPDAHLSVRGEPFPLNPDGTFSLEMDLPDSTQVIPVFATDAEGDFPTTIIPVVVKRTE
jgi:hypothetical protein